MSQYRLEELSFCHEGAALPTLREISAVLPAGKTTLLLGGSGTGKSTLIEVLCHIAPEYRPGEVGGRCHCPGADWQELSLKQMAKQTGFVFQNPESQFCTYTVADELAFGPENLCLPREEIEERVQSALSLLGIAALYQRPLHSLSGGEKQRVAIASVLTCNPPLLIFDEPTSNLDPLGIAEILQLIDDLKNRQGKTILLVEHQLEHLWEKADHLLVLGAEGRLLFSGDMQEGFAFLRARPNLGLHLPPALEFCQKLPNGPSAPLLQATQVAAWLCATRQTSCGRPPLQPPDAAGPPRAFAEVLGGDFKEDPAPSPPAQEAAPLLRCRGLRLALGGRPVLKNLDFTLCEGDFLAIVGPNGAGKTTLLHSLLGIYPNTEGEIELLGKPLKKWRSAKWDKAGIVFQNPEWQFVANSAVEEILYSLKRAKMPKAEKEALAEETLRRFGLWEKREQSPFALSQGEKRRLSVASLLVRRQKILLLDEPTYGQDKHSQDELLDRMCQLVKNGVSLAMISHNMDLVYRYCNRAVLLVDGEILFSGSPAALFANPALCAKGRLEIPFWRRVGELLPGTPVIRSTDEAIQYSSLQP